MKTQPGQLHLPLYPAADADTITPDYREQCERAMWAAWGPRPRPNKEEDTHHE